MNAGLVTFLAVLYHGYYHQLILTYALIVGAHAVVHGLGPAMVAALLGTFLVPYAIQAGQDINLTDPIYALIYLTGAALLPWTGGQLARRRSLALSRQLKVTQATQREAVMILARAAEAKDQVTGDHVARVGDLSAELGRRVGLSEAEVEDLRFAGMLHDVGKLHLPDRVLLKRGRLTRAEWELVKQHAEWGERILGSTEGFELARRIARSHHENFDGTGYPDHLNGDLIPLVARIVRIADVFDALRHERPYKEAWTLAHARRDQKRGRDAVRPRTGKRANRGPGWPVERGEITHGGRSPPCGFGCHGGLEGGLEGRQSLQDALRVGARGGPRNAIDDHDRDPGE